MTRAFNFSAGPATLPQPVLERAAAEMLDWRGSGVGVMEMSHRGREFGDIFERCEARLRALLEVPANYRVLFMQGGGLAENAIVPLNLSRGGVVDHVLTGTWSKKSAKEAQRYADVRIAADNELQSMPRHTGVPDPASWRLSPVARYLHLCSNETIDGVEFHELPDLRALGSDAPLVIDCSSHLASRPIDWRRVALAYGGAQKNIGPAGLTLVFVRDDLLGHALPACPSAFDYSVVAANGSMYNTPPTWAIYIAGLVFEWLDAQGGINTIEQRNILKAQTLYAAIDGSGGFYRNAVEPACRSRMNVPFFIHDDALHAPFVEAAAARGLLALKGHKSVGGLRASIYNAMPLEGVLALVDHMQEFAASHG